MVSSAGDAGGRLYRQLEVGPTASHDEIVRSYRRLAHDVHPDVNPDDPEAAQRFQEITKAYEVLSDPARRARYDRAQRDRPVSRRSRPRSVFDVRINIGGRWLSDAWRSD